MPNTSFREAFLHYIWQYQYFEKSNLCTTDGESLQILSPGFINKNSGPDFYNCRLLLKQIEWHGTVEVHYKTSDWNKHKHAFDKAYNNVVLHLVWEQDQIALREDGSKIPTLELKNRIDKSLISRYKAMVENAHHLHCSAQIGQVDTLFVYSMLDRVLVERMEAKAQSILQLFEQNKNDWEETCYQWLGKCFGFKINSEPFLRLCTELPYSILKKYRTKPIQTEALLFGLAGFLSEKSDELYYNSIQNEFEYLKQKHTFNSNLNVSEWKFLRLRPANFPTIRIAQFAAFLNQTSSLYDFIFNNDLETNNLKNSLSGNPNSFWSTHFHFGKDAKSEHDAKMGNQSIENIIINAVIPLRFAHAMYFDKTEEKENILELLRQLKPEKNNLLSVFNKSKLVIQSAYESQAFIQLHNEYCLKKECLSCTIGHQILHPKSLTNK